MQSKKGVTFLFENVLLIVLTLVFFMIAMTFVYRQGNSAAVLEQSYAKNIALLIDASQPVMEMKFNMGDAFEIAEKNGIARDEVVSVVGNVVRVKLKDRGGYAYSFFNDYDVTAYPDVFPGADYIIKINGYR
jgi:hypothetical protein